MATQTTQKCKPENSVLRAKPLGVLWRSGLALDAIHNFDYAVKRNIPGYCLSELANGCSDKGS